MRKSDNRTSKRPTLNIQHPTLQTFASSHSNPSRKTHASGKWSELGHLVRKKSEKMMYIATMLSEVDIPVNPRTNKHSSSRTKCRICRCPIFSELKVERWTLSVGRLLF